MKKNDYIIVAILVGLMFVWMKFFPILEQKYFPRPEQPASPVATTNTDAPADAPSNVSPATLVETVP
ncbi:MAG: hypothetical protein FJ220_05045, partial [Kiritimatiellaceae bacterium]|nr:hypothetical protein [Kiritimatiellaceae bacterium]